MIPKTTDPLSKFIRTGEGILVFAFNIALLVVPIVSNALTPAQSAKWAAIIDGITVICRTGLKMVATKTQAAARQPVSAAPALSVAGASGGLATAEAIAAAVAAALPGIDAGSAQLPAAVSRDATDVAKLVSDVEEFADAPPAVLAPAASRGPQPVASGSQPGLLGTGPTQTSSFPTWNGA
jgi:hypothetical protein